MRSPWASTATPTASTTAATRTEASNRILERVVAERLVGVERSLALDLHTGHGARCEITFLSDEPEGTEQDRFLRQHFGRDRVLATVDNPDASTGTKSGQIASGFATLLHGATHHATSVEFGTTPDEQQLAATYLESWVDRHGDRSDPDHARVVWDYRCCFTPPDPQWEAACRASGAELIDAAVRGGHLGWLTASAGLVGLDEIRAAHERIRPHVLRTPLVAMVGGGVLLKAEGLQPVGSFKIRGAVNSMLGLGPDEQQPEGSWRTRAATTPSPSPTPVRCSASPSPWSCRATRPR